MGVNGNKREDSVKTAHSSDIPLPKKYILTPNVYASKIPLDLEPYIKIHGVFYRYCNFNCYFCRATKKRPKAFVFSDPKEVMRCLVS